jgi:hypothetical protein
VAFSLAAPVSWAHDGQFPRMVQFAFAPQRLTVGLGITRHAGPQATALRARFDADTDGRLSEPERGDLALWLEEQGRRSLRIILDGEPLHPEVVERKLTLSDEVLAGSKDVIQLRVAAVLAIGLCPGTHRVELHDRPEGGRQLVPVRLDLPSGWELSDVLAEGEATPLARAGEYSWQGAFAGRGGTLSFTLEVPGRGQLQVGEVDSSTARGANESSPQVGSPSTRSEP